MTRDKKISDMVIKRLPRYYRFLSGLEKKRTERISSGVLANKMGLTASQIRQDLNCFGGFGQQGYGYHVSELKNEIGKILGIGQNTKAVLIGAGNLGTAVAMHIAFEQRGFQLIGIFDNDRQKLGRQINGIPISDTDALDAFCKNRNPEVAILCVPYKEAQKLTEQLVECGVKAFWNFSHYDIGVEHADIVVENVHIGDSLMSLGYKMKDLKEEEKD